MRHTTLPNASTTFLWSCNSSALFYLKFDERFPAGSALNTTLHHLGLSDLQTHCPLHARNQKPHPTLAAQKQPLRQGDFTKVSSSRKRYWARFQLEQSQPLPDNVILSGKWNIGGGSATPEPFKFEHDKKISVSVAWRDTRLKCSI